MVFRVLGLLAALAMLGSLFLPWIATQFGPPIVPWDLIKPLADLDANGRARLMQTAPPAELVAFGLSFVAALLFILTAASSRFLAILAGGLPIATVGILYSRAADATGGFGADLPAFDAPDFPQQVSEFINFAGPGLLLWLGGAAVLLFIGLLLSPSR